MSPDEPNDSYNYSYSPGNSGQPSVAIVKAVAEQTGKDFRELKPLQSIIDAECLNRLFAKTVGRIQQDRIDPDDGVRSITFGYEGYEVTVRDGNILVKPI